MNKLKSFIITLLLFSSCIQAKEIIGYYENWAQYRTGYDNQYACKPQDLNTSYIDDLTVLNYGFAFFNFGYVDPASTPPNDPPYLDDKSGYKVYDDWKIYPSEWNDTNIWTQDNGLWAKAVELKTSRPNLKVLLSIGGWNFCTTDPFGGNWYGKYTHTFWHEMAASETNRAAFIASVIDVCTTYGFDGIDIDWEYPGATDHGGDGTDYKNFISLLSELRTETASIDNFKITMAAPAVMPTEAQAGSYTGGSVDPATPQSYFDWLGQCSVHLDWFNIMAYDYYGAGYSPTTAANGPLTPYKGLDSIEDTIGYYITAGIAKTKLMLGIPAYGHTFQAASFPSTWDPNQKYGPGCTYSGADIQGPLTLQSGFLSYIEIANMLSNQTPKTFSELSDPSSTSNLTFDDYFKAKSYLYGQENSGEAYDGAFYNTNTGTWYAYAIQNGRWVSFDAPEGASFLNGSTSSVKAKCDYINNEELGGAMIWALDDDFYKNNPSSNILKTIGDTITTP